MVPSGPPPPPVGGNPTVSLSPASLPRTNSAILGGQGGGVAEGAIAPSQTAFPSLLSSRPHYGNLNMLGNLSNLSSIPGGGGNSGIGMNQGFNGGGNAATATSQTNSSNSGISGTANIQRGRMTMGSDSLSIAGGAMGAFSSSSTSMNLPGSSGSMVRLGGTSTTGQSQLQSQLQQHFANSNAQLSQDQQQQARHQQGQQMSHQQGQQQGQEMVSTLQQLQGQNILGGARGFQQFQGQNMLGLGASQQHQMQTLRGLTGDQGGQQQQLQSLRSLGSVKLDPQQLQSLRSSLASVKMEQQHGDQSILLQHQHQQQQQLLQLARQPSPQVQQLQAAQMNLLHQQRILQQQQLLQAFPQQRSQLQQQPSQQLQQQNLQVTPPTKPQAYETGMCARLLMQYMFHQQQRPTDNSIDFWRKFVAKYFAPHAKKRWCVSLYGSGRQTTGVFPQDVWHCEICGTKPGRGFETTVEVLPRLCKIKYDSGTLEELLYVDMPREYQIHSGHYVLEYEKAIQESVFEQLRVVRDGQLRIVFSSDLKICSWEFCARSHEELIPRRLLIPQVSQLGVIAQKYQASIQNGTTNLSSQDLQTNCNMFVASARQLAKALEVPLVNDLGYTKRYVRCLQISEVVNSMKDLIDFSRENKIGPIESLNKFPRRTHISSERQNQTIQTQEHQIGPETLSSEQSAGQASTMQPAPSNAVNNGNISINTSSLASSTSTIAGLLHQNSMNSRQGSRLSVVTSSFASTVQVPSVGSSNSLQQSHASPGSSFPNSGSSVSNSVQVAAAVLPTTTVQLPQTSATANVLQQQPVQPAELDRSDSESSVQHIIQEMMMSSQRNGGGSLQQGVGGSNVGGNLGVNMGMSNLGSDMKNLNGMVPTGSGSGAPKGANGLVGNCFSSNASVDANSLGGIPSMPGSANNMISMGNDIPMSSNTMTLNGRANMTSITQNLTIQDPNFNLQQDFGGNRLLNGFNSVGSFNNMQFDWKSP